MTIKYNHTSKIRTAKFKKSMTHNTSVVGGEVREVRVRMKSKMDSSGMR